MADFAKLNQQIKEIVERRAPSLKPPMVLARNTAQKAYWRLFGPRWTGYCPICERQTRFVALGKYYRDDLICRSCHSIPRERALIRVIDELYPQWRSLRIHESSPGQGGASLKLKQECTSYTASQFVLNRELGSEWQGFRVEDLERQTFEDASFDLVVTQDVFEHLMEPGKAITEIVRTLSIGGAHIMTVPLVRRDLPSERRAALKDGEIMHLKEPQYHDNPAGDGSLVTVDWGFDIADYLAKESGCATTIHTIQDRSQGLEADYLEVVITRKAATPQI